MSQKLSFFAGCLFELALLIFAFMWGWLFHRPALLDLHWSINAALIGIVAAVPPFLFFLWTLNSRLHVFSRHRQLMESLLRPLFGAFHLLTWTYAIIAAIIGAYLGLLWIWTGNLLTPMVTHAVYDFVALVYFFRFRRPG